MKIISENRNTGFYIHKVKSLFKWGVVHQVGVVNILSSELMMFGWGIPLKIKYHNLYEICCDLECIVEEVRENGEWIVQFRRGFTDDLFQQWDSLVEELEMVQLSIEGDVVKWPLEKSGCYRTKSLYRQTSLWLVWIGEY
jgi:hypothetical protein